MLNFLKNHPFAVETHFDSSTVLTFAVPKEQLESLIPTCLSLDTFEDAFQKTWAFVAVAMVDTKGLRPKGLPAFMGNDFFLIGYRIFVRYTTQAGKKLRGLYIIKSETNKKKMEFFGNIFTHYNYTTTDITTTSQLNTQIIESKKSNFRLCIEQTREQIHETLADKTSNKIQLPEKSPFADWKQARRFAGPLPFTFTYQEKTKTVLIIEGVRQNWQPQPIEVISYEFEFLNSLQLQDVVLANAFEIKNIPYYWKKGKLEKL
jgi:hypothetical protein